MAAFSKSMTFNANLLPKTTSAAGTIGSSNQKWDTIYATSALCNTVSFGYDNNDKYLLYTGELKRSSHGATINLYNITAGSTAGAAGTRSLGLTLNVDDYGKGHIQAPGRNVSWNQSNTRAMIIMDTAPGWSPLWSIKTNSGWWSMGHCQASGYYDALIFGFLADSNVAGVANAENKLDPKVRLIKTTGEKAFITAPFASSKAVVGSTTLPVYVNDDGVVTPLTYSLKATVNNGTANTLAYYSGANAVSSASNFSINTTKGDITITSTAGIDSGFRVVQTDGPAVWMGIGSGNANHGIYSTTLGKWMVYADASNVYLNGAAETLKTGRTLKVSLGSTAASTAFNGSANITDIGVSGTLAVANGGTGKTTGKDAANYFLNALDPGSSTPVDADYYISQYVNGGTTTTTYYRRPMSALWAYVKGKLSSVSNVNISGDAGRAQLLRNYYVDTAENANSANRPTNANVTATGSGGLITFKATAAMVDNAPPAESHIIHFFWDNTGGYDAQLAIKNSYGTLYSRGSNRGTWTEWLTQLDSSNYTSYTVKKDGTGASGNWSINITGTAALTDAMRSTDPVYGDTRMRYYVTNSTGTIKGFTGWGHHIILNHGATDHGVIITFPYWDCPRYYRTNDETWRYFAVMKQSEGFWGFDYIDWIRMPQEGGILPYQRGEAGSGHNYLGTSTWYFAHAYIDYVHSSRVDGAVWNDYAEYRNTHETVKSGQCVIDNDDGTLQIANSRLLPGAQVVSDTFGFSIGETDSAKTPLAVSGRVLVYTYQDRNNYHAGQAVCTAPNGTVDIMTREEIKEYPDCIIGIVSEIPKYETWGTGNVKVDNRIWIKIK